MSYRTTLVQVHADFPGGGLRWSLPVRTGWEKHVLERMFRGNIVMDVERLYTLYTPFNSQYIISFRTQTGGSPSAQRALLGREDVQPRMTVQGLRQRWLWLENRVPLAKGPSSPDPLALIHPDPWLFCFVRGLPARQHGEWAGRNSFGSAPTQTEPVHFHISTGRVEKHVKWCAKE